jgi:hypothetical protein
MCEPGNAPYGRRPQCGGLGVVQPTDFAIRAIYYRPVGGDSMLGAGSSGGSDTAQPLAATKQARRPSLWHQRCTEGTQPTVRYLATLAIKQASFSAQRSRETARRSRRRTVWRFARCSIGPLREAPNSFLLRVLERPPCFSVLKNLLPYFGPAATTQHRSVSAGQREGGCISRGDAQ